MTFEKRTLRHPMNQQDEDLKILVDHMVIPPPNAARKDAALKSALAALESQPLPVTVNHLQEPSGGHHLGNQSTPPEQQ